MFDYLVKENEFLPVKELDESGLNAISSGIRRDIIKRASSRKLTVSEIIEEMDIDRQTAYYHLGKLQETGLLNSEGSRPKSYEAEKSAYYFKPDFVKPNDSPLMLENVPDILQGFVENRKINTRLVVGAPYPHGEYNRRHKTAYKAGELSTVLGNYGRKRNQIIYTDTELNENKKELPLIAIAGPLVNTFSAELNSKMPAKFTEDHDKIITENRTYSGDGTGFVTRKEIDGKLRMVVAGLFGLGTSAAIEALASRPEELGENGAVVKGYGTKQSIEEVEIVELL